MDNIVENITIEYDMPNSQKRELFDCKYAAFFNWLGVQPRTNPDNSRKENAKINSQRFEAAKEKLGPLYDEFVMDVLKVFSIDFFSDRQLGAKKYTENVDNSEALFECLRKTIIYFDGNREGGIDTFRINLANNYNHAKLLYSTKIEEYDRFIVVTNKQKKGEMLKLYRLFDELNKKIRVGSKGGEGLITSIELDKFNEFAKMVMEQANVSLHLTDEDLRSFYHIVCAGSNISLDEEVGDDSDITIGDMQEDKSALSKFSNMENREQISILIDKVSSVINDGSYFKVSDREIFRLYFTESLLKVLKLDANEKPYVKEPAGNKDIYELLNPKEAELMGVREGKAHLEDAIFHEEYLPYVFGKDPNSMYDTYCWKLAEGVALLGKDIVECMGYGSKGTESKKRKAYYQLLQGLNLLSDD